MKKILSGVWSNLCSRSCDCVWQQYLFNVAVPLNARRTVSPSSTYRFPWFWSTRSRILCHGSRQCRSPLRGVASLWLTERFRFWTTVDASLSIISACGVSSRPYCNVRIYVTLGELGMFHIVVLLLRAQNPSGWVGGNLRGRTSLARVDRQRLRGEKVRRTILWTVVCW